MVAAAGEDGGVGTLGFHVANPAGLGRTEGGGPGGVVDAGFSNAAILSRREPTFGFGGVDIVQKIAGGRGGRGARSETVD